MAQRKSTPSGKSGRGSGASRPGGKPGTKPAGKTAGRSSSATRTTAPVGRPPARKKPKSIVNQKQTPWGLIATTAAVVVFAAAVIIVVIATRPSDSGSGDTDTASKGGQTVKSSDPYRRAELPAAAAIKGVVYRVQAEHTHTDGTVKYDTTPPTGGKHNQYWADCSGTVYSKAIANENAVHMLEHGAIWVTYNADKVKGAQLTKLKSYVSGVDRIAMSPYPGLDSAISLQAWGYQLKVSSASDPRIAKFISVLKNNKSTTPEYGVSCSNPDFKEKPSTFGHPTDPLS
ncbi:Protein of unknown function [Jatrophihabitans endophyticus]|uniref:DUF3105 domain-containing protein n=1 Tax=Jatrophihabitans endophyticus TaxID=1206085 RepID=A0A1M5DMM3_9ACTN|nr:DUF3105 domain-containing protein [Jatrophihabitans endophyticus]SHF68032.1 Protein of unknown function [Jatrophihabitans endophyticus]